MTLALQRLHKLSAGWHEVDERFAFSSAPIAVT
jgi:hypothetical protein